MEIEEWAAAYVLQFGREQLRRYSNAEGEADFIKKIKDQTGWTRKYIYQQLQTVVFHEVDDWVSRIAG